MPATMEAAIQLGANLLEARQYVAHGGWEDWLRANTNVYPTTSRRWIRLALEGQKSDATKLIEHILTADTPPAVIPSTMLDITPIEATPYLPTSGSSTATEPGSTASNLPAPVILDCEPTSENEPLPPPEK